MPPQDQFSHATAPARVAGPADISEMVRLADLMYTSMGMVTDGGWRPAAIGSVTGRLGDDVFGAVVDRPGEPGWLAASGLGLIDRRLPSPTNPTGRVGYIQWVATDPGWRRRGFARAVLTSLLSWFDDHRVTKVELHATAVGEPLYRSLGFVTGDYPVLGRRRPAS